VTTYTLQWPVATQILENVSARDILLYKSILSFRFLAPRHWRLSRSLKHFAALGCDCLHQLLKTRDQNKNKNTSYRPQCYFLRFSMGFSGFKYLTTSSYRLNLAQD
jgi:hypothetical protein